MSANATGTTSNRNIAVDRVGDDMRVLGTVHAGREGATYPTTRSWTQPSRPRESSSRTALPSTPHTTARRSRSAPSCRRPLRSVRCGCGWTRDTDGAL
jgi:hypothetical protein